MYFNGIKPMRMMMKDFDMFWKFFPAGMTRTAFAKYTGHKLRNPIYAGHFVMSQNKGNELLKQLISGNDPFMFGRYGSNELWIAGYGLMKKMGIINEIPFSKLQHTADCCGFFPLNEESVIEFSDVLIDASKYCNVYGTFRMIWEDYFIKHFMPKDVKLTHLNMMDFWRYKMPFSCALKGKKVLVVHPLADQIVRQYEKRRNLFVDSEWLPEFDLKTLKPVQTIAGMRDPRFNTWFGALDFMKAEIEKTDFDIAVLGCGAYGMPLAAHIKKMGKSAIYMGGVLQMLFGIRGKRWDLMPKAAALYNDYWVSPDETSVPKKSDSVEGGCYW